MRLPVLLFLLLIAASCFPSAARAAGACEQNHLAAQEQRAAGKLLEARQALVRCATRSCPGLVDADCTKWLDELGAEIPTVVPSARAADGSELRDVQLQSNGETIAETLDGKPIELDPGPHTFVFLAAGHEPVSVDVVALTGVKNAPLLATFPDAVSTSQGLRPAAIASIALLGAGGAALLTFGGLAIAGEVQYRDLDESCRPSCDPDDVDAVQAKFLGADIALGVGCAALASALIVYLAVPSPSATVSIQIGPGAFSLQQRW